MPNNKRRSSTLILLASVVICSAVAISGIMLTQNSDSILKIIGAFVGIISIMVVYDLLIALIQRGIGYWFRQGQ